jgi:hypothetical protein
MNPAPIVSACLLAALAASTRGEFHSYSGNAAQEGIWRAAAGGVIPTESFESFSGVGSTGIGGDVITALPSLRVTFDAPAPGIYGDFTWAHSGGNQWCNWAGGAGNSASHVMRVEAGLAIYALGFWNCDPQGDQPMQAFGFDDQPIGTISGVINLPFNAANSNSFAGFVSAEPVKYVVIPGALGDGWNHLDDLQIVTGSPTTIPGDTNYDGDVDFADLISLAQNYGIENHATRFQGDVTGDGAVGFPDLVALAQNYGFGSPEDAAAAMSQFAALRSGMVPEPAALGVAGAAVSFSLGRRRRRART